VTKFNIAVISFLVLVVSIVSVGSQSYYLQLLVDTSPAYAALRGMMVLCLLTYLLRPDLRTNVARYSLAGLGLALFATSSLALVSPTLLGWLPIYYPIGDAILFLELGVWMMVASYELPVIVPEPAPAKVPLSSYAAPLSLLRQALLDDLVAQEKRHAFTSIQLDQQPKFTRPQTVVSA
jgi:hypothetical protein